MHSGADPVRRMGSEDPQGPHTATLAQRHAGPPPTTAVKPGRLSALAVLLVAAVYAATLLWLPDEGLWIVDNGNKLIQLEAIVASGHRDYSIPWPGRILDPKFEFNPIPPPFSIVHEGRLYTVFSPAFPALASFFYAALGPPGLYVLPFVAGVALLVGLVALVRVARLPRAAEPTVVLVAGLGTPVWFYSVVFWEHILAASLVVWSVAGWLAFMETRRAASLLASGLACAAAVWFRDQLLLLAALMGLLAFARAGGGRWRAVLLFTAGLAAGLLPLAVFQWLALGDPVGFHLTHGFAVGAGGDLVPRLSAHLAVRGQALYQMFFAWALDMRLSVLLALPLVLLLLWRPALPRRGWEVAVVGCAVWGLAGAAVTGIGLATSASPIEWLLRANGFWSAAPLLALGLVRCRDLEDDSPASRVQRRLWELVVLYSVAYTVLSPIRNVAGIHWGNRYLLVLYPLLSVLCAANLFHAWRLLSRTRLVPVAMLLAASLGLQLQGIDLLARKKDFGRRLAEAVRERPEEIVVTDVWWLGQQLASEFYRRKIFLVQSDAQLNRLRARLSSVGERRFLFVTTSIRRVVEPGATVVDDAGLGFFSQQLVPRRL